MLTYYVFSRCRASPKDPLVAISPYTMTVYLSDFYLTSGARGPMPFFHVIVSCEVRAVPAEASAGTLVLRIKQMIHCRRSRHRGLPQPHGKRLNHLIGFEH